MFSFFFQDDKLREEQSTQMQWSAVDRKLPAMESNGKQDVSMPPFKQGPIKTQADRDPPSSVQSKDTCQFKGKNTNSESKSFCNPMGHDCQKEEDDIDHDCHTGSTCNTSLGGDSSQNEDALDMEDVRKSPPSTDSSSSSRSSSSKNSARMAYGASYNGCEGSAFYENCSAENFNLDATKTPRQRAVDAVARNIHTTESELDDAKKTLVEITHRIKSLELRLASHKEDMVAAEKELVQETKALDAVNQLLAGFILI
jgi:hypothetical protein